MKTFLKKLLFSKPKLMVKPIYISVFKDSYGNLYVGATNGAINPVKNGVNGVGHIDTPKYLGQIKIYTDYNETFGGEQC